MVSLILVAGGFLAWKTVSGLREVRFLDPWERAASQPIAFETRDGLLDLTELRGKIVLVDVWASWCAPCIQMIPNLVELQNEHREELQVIGVNVDINDWEDLESFLEKHQITYTVAMPGPGQSVHLGTLVDLEPLGTVAALPTLFLLDNQGRLVGKYGGGVHSQISQDVERLIREVVAATEPVD